MPERSCFLSKAMPKLCYILETSDVGPCLAMSPLCADFCKAEPWWVNSLARNSLVLPYTIGSRRLNKIYLDTTFAVNKNPYREFPSKANGLRELLDKVSKYPVDTVFHFHAWTFGYEEVWIALAAALNSQVCCLLSSLLVSAIDLV